MKPRQAPPKGSAPKPRRRATAETALRFGCVNPPWKVAVTEGRPRDEELDPGDAVPEGVAPRDPLPLTEEKRRAKEKLDRLSEERKPEV